MRKEIAGSLFWGWDAISFFAWQGQGIFIVSIF
jgi:hypothetical protein